MIDVTVQNGTIDQKEIDAYIAYGRKKYPGKSIIAMDVTLDGDFVDLKYQFSPQPFERIRRITGYLVGTLDRFNDAKRAEERDRVKHGV
ncbi:MAG TPA: hypothetical protein IAB15_05005 [Candidatus Ornithoclostridium faecigallinarum]|nr:hypothetical protein [Candidatus Ornithoclostridium faecigallinarum]